MGKAQSKRSVDITTENKEGVAVADGESGKVGKIEEVDQKPQVNGDANKEADSGSAEAKQEEKKDEVENEKDAATEKSEQPAEEPAEAKPSDAPESDKPAENGEEAEKADTTTGTLDESKDGVETGDDAAVTDSAKKPKKDKSKKRFFSFRSLSFSKKDKTKPKKEEAAANTTNGEIEKVPEEGAEEAAATPSGEENVEAVTVTNGTTEEEAKTNGEQAPVATPEESVTPPANGDSKPIVEAAKETVEEVIVAASKSVDEKLNSVAKPEVNKNVDQDLQEKHSQALESAANVQEHEHEQSLSSEKANIDTVPNNIVDTDTNSVGVVDCTNNSSNNDNINSQSAPPLPDSPPPSQITVFAESAMSVDFNQVENPQTIPIIETETIVQTNSVLVDDTKIELNVASETVVGVDEQTLGDQVNSNEITEPVTEVGDAKLATSIEHNEPQTDIEVVDVETHKESENESEQIAESVTETPGELPKPDAEIAETIAILDRVNLNESDVKLAENVVTDANTESQSADISSPLPQNSLETLPSPQSLSSNVTPPNEIEESATIELSNEDTSSLPPPPPIDDIALDKATEQAGSKATVELIQNGNDDLLPPPPAEDVFESDIIDELKTNGVNAEHDQNHSVEALSGDGTLNGSAKDHDEAANNISDKANGVGNDNSVSEKLNGDHKTIEEIATSPEKLEKLAAANPPPSTEVVAAE